MNRRELKAYQYRRMLEERRGHNYEYWGPKHDQMLESGWKILEMKGSGLPGISPGSSVDTTRMSSE